ncbi:MAG: S49 family peptidase, partial [Rhizobiales bacterium]|nr:S49 family peptidase [Hyphomicrobiales bacterium]
MAGQLHHLADRLLNTPLLIHPNKAEVLLAVLAGRIGLDGDLGIGPGIDATRFVGSARRESGRSALTRAANGVAIVPVLDTLVNRGAWLDSRSGLTSYEGIGAQIRDAGADSEVHAILLDVSSPGGEAAGMSGVADLIRAVRQTKPVVAFVNDMAASAAYGIASAADEIVVSPTSILGSIGVVMIHADRSGELAAQGIRPTLIFAGSHKVDGNPFEPLSDAVRADLQASVDAHYDQFVGLVAAGRGDRLTTDGARSTEARTFIGTNAVALGLADRIATFDEVLAGLSRKQPAGRPTRTGGTHMSTSENAPAPDGTVISVADRDAAVTAARTEERARIRAIVTSAAAEG